MQVPSFIFKYKWDLHSFSLCMQYKICSDGCDNVNGTCTGGVNDGMAYGIRDNIIAYIRIYHEISHCHNFL